MKWEKHGRAYCCRRNNIRFNVRSMSTEHVQHTQQSHLNFWFDHQDKNEKWSFYVRYSHNSSTIKFISLATVTYATIEWSQSISTSDVKVMLIYLIWKFYQCQLSSIKIEDESEFNNMREFAFCCCEIES